MRMKFEKQERVNVICERCNCWGHVGWYEKIDDKYLCKECHKELMEEFK